MNLKAQYLILFSACIISACVQEKTKQSDPSLTLWYDNPAKEWVEALPVGNGRLGAMVYGRTSNEIIQFNESTLWTGQPHDYAHPGAYKYLDTLRALLWAGKQAEAHNLANDHFMSIPLGQLSYQPFGNILLQFPGHDTLENYRRELNLKDGIARVTYDQKGVTYTREIFSSYPDQAIMMRITSSQKGKLNLSAFMSSPQSAYDIALNDDMVVLTGQVNNYQASGNRQDVEYPESKMTFQANLKVINDDGEILSDVNKIWVKNATSVTLQLVAATNFVRYDDISGDPGTRCEEYLSQLNGKSYEEVKNTHVADYKQLFDRVSIDLGDSTISKRPTNVRLETFQQDHDPSLVALLYQYGRYLLITSSRPNTQPANLQGIWNDRLAPPWDSKYTININTEMNYWPAEMTNLSELTQPLHLLVKDISETGRNVAKEHYNLGGWVAHHNTDLWRGTAPINHSNHGIWVTGGAWLSQHLWWHYEYTGDKTFLKDFAYPIMKSASEFFVDYLVPDPNHPEWLISGPSNSPENGGLVMGPTMDHQIIRNLMANTIETAGILGVDEDFTATLKDKRARIAPNQIGQYGQLQEWMQDVDDPKNEHRHVSHLWGLHPGNEIHPLTTPELAEACRVTLSHRGDGGTGWSRAWKINFWARLLDGDHAFLMLSNLMVPSIIETPEGKSDRGGLYPNLFDSHAPFQIDGNFGATAGITEFLLQSHLRDDDGNYYQDILPALPSGLANGSISGIKGRGGFEFAIAWQENTLSSLKVKSLLGNPLIVRYRGKEVKMDTEVGQDYVIEFN
ncbi:MAG: glycoside hydrolase N-terminal domain-containing protein [Bacteroidota bacterium]